MKTTITLLLIILSFAFTQAQAPAIQWQKQLGGSNIDFAQSIQQTSDGGYIVVGISNSADGDVTGHLGAAGSYDYWVAKLSATGLLQWQKSFGGTNTDYAYSIQQTTDGGYILAGESFSTNVDVTGNHGGGDYWVIKLSTTGTIEWQKALGGTGEDIARSIQQTADGGYIVAGSTTSTNGDVSATHVGADFWLVKLSSTGDLQWHKLYGRTANDIAYCVQQTTDGGYILAGQSTSTTGEYDYWIVKTDDFGELQWQHKYGGTTNDIAYSIDQTTDGGYIVAGQTLSNNGDVTGAHVSACCGVSEYWVVKLNATGAIEWQKALGGTEVETGRSIQQTADGGYIIAGNSFSSDGDITGVNHSSGDFWIVKLNNSGVLQWEKLIGGTGNDNPNSIHQTSDGGYIIGGESRSNNFDASGAGGHGSADYWVVKLAPDALLTVPVFEKQKIVISPNPVCDVLQIQVPNNTTITEAKIIDITGKFVYEQSQNGNTINVENLAQGMYILEAYSGENKYVTKFVKE